MDKISSIDALDQALTQAVQPYREHIQPGVQH